MPGSPRSSRLTTAACAASAAPSSPASTSTYFSLLWPKPTLMRAPGSTASACRNSPSMACLLTPCSSPLRSPRGVRFSVSVALRTSGRPLPGSKVLPPVAPPPTAV